MVEDAGSPWSANSSELSSGTGTSPGTSQGSVYSNLMPDSEQERTFLGVAESFALIGENLLTQAPVGCGEEGWNGAEQADQNVLQDLDSPNFGSSERGPHHLLETVPGAFLKSGIFNKSLLPSSAANIIASTCGKLTNTHLT
jgi:hypothetical protein